MRFDLLILVPVFFLCACSRQNEDSHLALENSELENELTHFVDRTSPLPESKTKATPRKLTPEQEEVLEMRNLLDDDKTGLALRHARNLMDSSDREIREAVLETLQWIGHRALPEISEMLNDPDEQISADAMTAWELAFGEIDGDHQKAAVIKDSLLKVKNESAMQDILEHCSDIRLSIVLPILTEIIKSNNGTALAECARECYQSLIDGESIQNETKTRENKR